MEFRRRVPRQNAGWAGYCSIDGDTTDEPRQCRVLDISELGIGILVDHPEGSSLVGRGIAVESSMHAASVSFRLEGHVKNVVAESGAVRLGVEFVGLTELEQTVVKALGVLSDSR